MSCVEATIRSQWNCPSCGECNEDAGNIESGDSVTCEFCDEEHVVGEVVVEV